VPETPEELFARAAGALRMPPVETWETFPFDGELRPRALQPPLAEEAPRRGEGSVDCWRCQAPDSEFAWVSERWRLHPLAEPSGLPVVLILEPRAHYGEPGELPDEHAAEHGFRLPQLIGSFAAVWDDVLPPTPEEIWRANVDAVVAALEREGL
jgi:hypothetical protein